MSNRVDLMRKIGSESPGARRSQAEALPAQQQLASSLVSRVDRTSTDQSGYQPHTDYLDRLVSGSEMPSVVKFADVQPSLAVTEQGWTGHQSVCLGRLNTPIHLCLISQTPEDGADHLTYPCREHDRTREDHKTFGALVHQPFLPSQPLSEWQRRASPERGIALIQVLHSELRTVLNKHLAEGSLYMVNNLI